MALYVWRFKGHPQCRAGGTDVYSDRQGRLLYMRQPRRETMIPTTTRVGQHTDKAVNEQIRRRTEQSISYVGRQGRYEISRRLEDLDHEWDMERTLEANAASITLLGLGLGTFVNRRLFMLPAMVAGFLLQHAVQGWCPPVPFFRRLGFRTAREIDSERYALKAIRGDFDNLPAMHTLDEGKTRRILAVMNR